MENIDGDDPSLWSLEFENIFIQILVEFVNSGRIVNGVVYVNLWSLIVSRLSEMTGWTYTAAQCRTKFSRLKMNYHEFSDLLNHQTGFGWDPVANTVHGTETQ
jgi:hypothetical protein